MNSKESLRYNKRGHGTRSHQESREEEGEVEGGETVNHDSAPSRQDNSDAWRMKRVGFARARELRMTSGAAHAEETSRNATFHRKGWKRHRFDHRDRWHETEQEMKEQEEEEVGNADPEASDFVPGAFSIEEDGEVRRGRGKHNITPMPEWETGARYLQPKNDHFLQLAQVTVANENDDDASLGMLATESKPSLFRRVLIYYKNDPERRRWCRRIALVFLVSPICILLALVLLSQQKDHTEEPAGQSFETPAPPVSLLLSPITVLIKLDNAPEETGWTLICNGETVAFASPGTYGERPGELISETVHVPEGSECEFTIFDFFDDGLCCFDGRGFYQVYVAEPEEVPKGFVVEGSEFGNSEKNQFVAKSRDGEDAESKRHRSEWR